MKEIIIVTGKINSGKSTVALQIIDSFNKKGLTTAGITTKAEYNGGIKSRYYTVDLKSGERYLLASEDPMDTDLFFGRFYFSVEAFEKASDILQRSMDADVILIDEIGPLEYSEKGYYKDLCLLTNEFAGILILVIREKFREKLIEKLGFEKLPIPVSLRFPSD